MVTENPEERDIKNFLPVLTQGIEHALSMYKTTFLEGDIIYGLFYTGGQIDMEKTSKILALKSFYKQNGENDYETLGSTFVDVDRLMNGDLNTGKIFINNITADNRRETNNTLFHEVDHLVFYILLYLRNKERCGEVFSQMHPFYGSVVYFKTECLARINSGNLAIRDRHSWNEVFMIGGREAAFSNDQGYREACDVSVSILKSRNRIYNLCIKKWGVDKTKPENFNIHEPGMNIFDTLCKAVNDYLFYSGGINECINFAVFLQWVSFQPDIRTAFNLIFKDSNVQQSPELAQIYNSPVLKRFQEANAVARTMLGIT